MKRIAIIMAMALLLIGGSAYAEMRRNMAAYINQEIDRVSEVLNQDNPAEVVATEDADNWLIKNFYLQLNIQVGFKIPFFAKATVVPQVELVWHKLDPDQATP